MLGSMEGTLVEAFVRSWRPSYLDAQPDQVEQGGHGLDVPILASTIKQCKSCHDKI